MRGDDFHLPCWAEVLRQTDPSLCLCVLVVGQLFLPVST